MQKWLVKHYSAIPVTIFFIFIGMIITYSLMAYIFYANQTKTSLIYAAQDNLKQIETDLLQHTGQSEKILEAIAQSSSMQPFLAYGTTSPNLIELFDVIIHSHESIMQIRLIDDKGGERIRLQREKEGALVTMSKPDELQDKSHRDYFIRSKTHRSRPFFSDLDLNVENEAVEIPFRPVYRIMLPLRIKNEFKGVLILNMFAGRLLESLNKYSQHTVILSDSEGYALYHYNPDFQWGRYQKPAIKISAKHLEKLQQKYTLTDALPIIHRTALPFSNALYLLIDIDQNTLKKSLSEHQHRFLFLGLFFVLISLFAAILVRLYLKRVADQIKTQASISEEHEKTLLKKSRFLDMSNLISMIAHQWRQPISVLMGIIGNLGYELEEKMPDSKQTLKKINEAEEMLVYLIRTIEDFRQMFNDDKIIHNFDLVHLIKKTYQICGSILETNNINTILVYPDEDGTPIPVSLRQNASEASETSLLIRGPSGELQQVLLNLLTNAKDALNSTHTQDCEKTIHIAIEKWESGYRLSISDNGIGIPVKDLHHVFDPYWSTKKNQNGTGLGLYMSQLIIQRSFGGEIHVNSIPNEGTTFTLLLSSDTSRKESHGKR